MNIDKKYEWLYDEINGLKEKIMYKDRIIYRISGKLHNPVDKAIIYLQDPNDPSKIPEKGEYYISGKKLEFDEWKIYNREHKMKKLIKEKKE